SRAGARNEVKGKNACGIEARAVGGGKGVVFAEDILLDLHQAGLACFMIVLMLMMMVITVIVAVVMIVIMAVIEVMVMPMSMVMIVAVTAVCVIVSGCNSACLRLAGA